MNIINKIIIVTLISLATSANSQGTCESTFTVNIDKQEQGAPQDKPDLHGCEINKLWIRADIFALDGSLPDFAALERLRGNVGKTPRLMLDIPYVFTGDYNHNMRVISAVSHALNITTVEVIGLVGDRSVVSNYPATQFKVMSLLTFLPLSWLVYCQGFLSPYHALNSVVAMGLYGALSLYAHDSISSDPVSAVVMRSTNTIISHLMCAVPSVLRLLRHTGVDRYLNIQFMGCHTWSLLKPNPPVYGYVYCIGGAPYSIQEIFSDEFTKIRFHNSRLSEICVQAFTK